MGQSLYPLIMYVQFKLYTLYIQNSLTSSKMLPDRHLYNNLPVCIQYKVNRMGCPMISARTRIR